MRRARETIGLSASLVFGKFVLGRSRAQEREREREGVDSPREERGEETREWKRERERDTQLVARSRSAISLRTAPQSETKRPKFGADETDGTRRTSPPPFVPVGRRRSSHVVRVNSLYGEEREFLAASSFAPASNRSIGHSGIYIYIIGVVSYISLSPRAVCC